MSIIEKAAGRLDKAKNAAPPSVAEAEAAANAAPAQEAGVRASAAAPAAASGAANNAVSHAASSAPNGVPMPAERVEPVRTGAPIAAVAAAAPAIPVVKPGEVRRAPSAATQNAGGAHVEINMALLERLGIVTPGMGRTPVAEEFRMIKRPLLQGAFAQDGSARHSNLIMVTSSLPGEGKTFCSINLAMSIAMEMDHTVLLVDADVARPSVLRTLGLEARPGLMDVLLDDKLELSDVMLRTNVDTLRILPAGRLHPNATELLASLSMTNLLDQIAQRYPDRIVIFDSPPLLLTSESKALAANMGQIVLVVEAETTTQHALKDAIRRLGATNNVSLIYNKTKAFSGDGSYGYGYN